MSSGGPDDRGGVGGLDTDHHDVGLAETMSPVPGAAAADPAATTQPSEVNDPALGDRPVSDRLQRAVSRAKIAGKLFATDERVKLGRYHLLEMVGAGGMGVVWGAWDPELDRRVAIKLVKATMLAARERILLEGQALAKLSHPNVVPVYDVGVVDDQIYLVMEWVRGKTLRAWCKQRRTVRELVAVYREAGIGLAAAHHAGLIHRDFKPDNVIRGDDGRVRVLDFGLARGEVKGERAKGDATPTPSSDLTRGAGTPRYMPPEQAQGGTLTPAVDQYAFCVSLREALLGRNADDKPADLPGWIDQIIARGAAHEVKARYDSMDELLRALARDPRTVWRRRAIVTGALGLAGAAFAIGTLRGGSDDTERCVGGKAEIAKTWNPQTRAALLAHVGGLGAYGDEESKKLDGELTAYGDHWAEAHRAACQARSRGELTPQLYERNLGCLVRAEVALQTVVGLLASVPIERLPDAIVAARELPLVDRCTAEATESIAPPGIAIAADVARIANDVESARLLAFAVDPTAIERATAAVAAADKLGYLPLVAKANLSLGLAQLMAAHEVSAIEPLGRATDAALAAGDDVVAIEAFARQVFATVTSAEPLAPDAPNALQAIPFLTPIAKRIGDAGRFARTLLYNNIGVSRMAAADRKGAREWFSQALKERQRDTGAATFELARVAKNLGLAVDDPAERARLFAESIAELTREVGPNHPVTLETRLDAAMFVNDPAVSERELQDVCDRVVKYHAHLRELIDRCSFELAWLLDERGDAAAARTWLTRVSDPEGRKFEIAAGFLLMFDGKYAEAVTTMEARGAKDQRSGVLWVMAESVDTYLIAAESLTKLGRNAKAIEALERSIAVLEPAAQAFSPFERRLARSRAMLAGLLRATDHDRSRTLAAAAAAWYRAAGGYERIASEMELLAR